VGDSFGKSPLVAPRLGEFTQKCKVTGLRRRGFPSNAERNQRSRNPVVLGDLGNEAVTQPR